MNIIKTKKGISYYKRIFHLVTPIVIQNLLSAAVSSADVIMLNSVGQSAISAVSLATQYTNILFMVFMDWEQGQRCFVHNIMEKVNMNQFVWYRDLL